MKSLISKKNTYLPKNKNLTPLIISLILHCLLLVFLGQFMLDDKKIVSLPVKLVILNSRTKNVGNINSSEARSKETSKSVANTVQDKQEVKQTQKVGRIIKKNAGIGHDASHNENSATSGEASKQSVREFVDGSTSVGSDGGSSGKSSNNYASDSNSMEGKVENLSDVVVTHKEIPKYPVFSRKLHEEGTVLLLLTVKNGVVCDVSIEKSSGFSRLDSSAQVAAKKWRFAGEKKFVVKVPFSFKLSN